MHPKVAALVVGVLLLHGGVGAQTAAQSSIDSAAALRKENVAKYGSNSAVGKTFIHDGISLYY